jgi:hypothetical protein
VIVLTFFLGIFGFLGILVEYTSFCDRDSIFEDYEGECHEEQLIKKKNIWGQVLLAFSITRNFNDLFAVQEYKTDEKYLAVLHGVKCIAYLWFITGEVFVFMVYTQPTNVLSHYNINGTFWFSMLFGNTFAVEILLFIDSFFFSYYLL